MPEGYDYAIRRCPTCGEEVPASEVGCAACGLPLPPPVHLPMRLPWYLKTLIVAGVLWVAGVAWYTFNVELPEARRQQAMENYRIRSHRGGSPPSGKPSSQDR